jgi:hypothetical protein
MWRHLLRLTAALLLWIACAAPALAQPPPQKQPDEDAGEVNVTHAPGYAVALLSSMLVLLIVCKPSRKT